MTTTASKVMALARSQIGVCEKPANSNKQKYGKAYGWNGTFWCAQFVWWCIWKSGGGDIVGKSASAAHIQDETVKKGGKWIMKPTRSADRRKAYLKQARPGDIVSFDFGMMDAYRDHTGLVDHVDGNYIYCIEGNTSKKGSQSNGGMVCEQRRLYIDVCSAVRPAYAKETTTGKGQTQKKKKPATNGAYKVGGTYTVATKHDPLNIRKGAGTDTVKLGSIPKGTKVKCLEVKGNWIKVTYKKTTGYICCDYLK